MTNFEFPVAIYNMEKYNEVLSKARCRIFYKYANRNGTYITDDFADKLLATIPYTPVKGIFSEIEGDYGSHGKQNSEGRIYGVVPEQYNLQWEDHVDDDGVTRTYACVDVLIFSELYEEAKKIVGKHQSMELFKPSLKYHKEIIDGQKLVVFDEGCFFGLQVLGDKVEPCFEGSSFYALKENIGTVVEKLQEIYAQYSIIDQGGENMVEPIFKLSDNEKYRLLWNLLNPEVNEEEYKMSYNLCEVYDEYVIAINLETGKYERVYYAKDDENDAIVLGEKVEIFIMDVTEEEKTTLDALRKLNGDTYSVVSETLIAAEENATKSAEFSTKIEELNATISTLTTEKSDLETQFGLSREENANLLAQNKEFSDYKFNVERNEKLNVLKNYSKLVSSETYADFESRIDEFDLITLDKELTYEQKKFNPESFSAKADGLIEKEIVKGGIEAILARY